MAPWYATLVVLDENDGGPGVLGRRRAAHWGALHLHLEVRGVLEREHEPEVLDDGFEHGPRLSRLLLVAGGLDEVVDGDRQARAIEVRGNRVGLLRAGGVLAGHRHLEIPAVLLDHHGAGPLAARPVVAVYLLAAVGAGGHRPSSGAPALPARVSVSSRFSAGGSPPFRSAVG